MPLPRAKDVPWTAGVSGVVFVLAMFSLSSPRLELAVFGAWGLLYLVECQVRGLFGRPVTATRPAEVARSRHQVEPPLDARGDERT
jgi:hypothetical protein